MGDDPPPPAPTRSRRRALWVAAGVAVLLALIVGGLTIGQRDGNTATGKGQARPIELPRLGSDGTVSLASLRGRPVVVNFFASWCVPCRKEMPAIQAVSAKMGDRVAFLGVDHQDDQKGALQLLADSGVRYPTGYDPEGEVAASYGLFGIPTTVFVAPDGRLLEKHTGELTQAQLEQSISRLFGV